MTSFIYALELFFLGNYIGLFLYFLCSFHYALLFPIIGISVFSFKNKKIYIFTCSMCVAFLLMGLWNGSRAGVSAASQLKPYWGKSVIVDGNVEPLSWKAKDGLQTFVLKVRDMEVEGCKIEYEQFIRVTVSAKPKLIDKHVRLSGKLHELVGFRNPGSFDSETYYRVQEIGGRLTKSKLLQHRNNDSFMTKLALLNIELRRKLDECMPSRLSHLLGGMLLGGHELENESREIFSDNGLSHLLSVSGTHLVLLAGLLGIILRPLPEKYQKLLIFLCLGVYALLCGLKAPIVRALVMSVVILFGGNGAEKGRLLGLAGMFQLLVKPEWILDIGFQLSFGASLGLIYLAPKLKSYFALYLPEIIVETVSVTMGVQLVTLPILINNFHQISLISIISNVILLPILEMTSLLTFCGLLLAYSLNINGLLRVSSFFIEQVLVQADVLRSLPFSTIAIASLPVWGYGLYYGCLILWLDKGIVKNLENQERKQYLEGMSVILLAVILWSNFYPKPFTVYFLDVGQGDCAVVVTPWRRTIVVDTGGLKNFDTGANILAPFLRSLGKKSIDYLVLSHYDYDHVGGLKGLLRNIDVKTIIMPRERLTESTVSIYEICKSSPARKIMAEEGLRFFTDGTRLEILGVGNLEDNGNEASSVVRVSYNDKSILFTGDMDATRENNFYANPKADVLKVAHHGSKTSSTQEFIARVSPKYAVISVGARNRYGHPNREVINTLQLAGSKVLRTDKLGCVKLSLVSDEFTLER